LTTFPSFLTYLLCFYNKKLACRFLGLARESEVWFALLPAHFLLPCNSSQKFGTKRVPNTAFTAIPNTTAAPKLMRLAAPAPVANNIGITPNTNANDVIIIGRNLTRPAFIDASRIG
jgi:hypothetical protein